MAKRMKIGVMGVGVLSLSLTLAGVGGFAPVAWADDHEAGMSEAGTTEAGTGTVQNTDMSREERQAKRAERRAEKKAKMKDRKETRKAKKKARQEKRQQNAS